MRKPVRGRIELGMIAGSIAKRICIREQMPADAIRIDELNDRRFFGHIGVHRGVAMRADLLDPVCHLTGM